MDNKNIIHSLNPLETSPFPYFSLEVKNKNCYPENLGFEVMHWHEDLQLVILYEGKLKINIVNETILLNQGEAIFLNKGVIHQILQDGECDYRSFIFNEKFLTFFNGSIMEQANVEPYTNNFLLPYIKFNEFEEWNLDIINKLKGLTKIEENKPRNKFYEYKVALLLTEVWYLIISNIDIDSLQKNKINDTKYRRIQKFISFIGMNYQDNISLKDIAESADVSESECIRCFKSIIDKTPYTYLIEYRLSRSIDLLKNTDHTITEISYMVGFNDTSHYISYFKKIFNITPLEFRRKYKSESK